MNNTFRNGFKEAFSIKNIHFGLDAIGLVPVIGEFADGVNAIVYITEGDFKSAFLSGISIVPVVGDASGKGVKYLKKVDDVIDLSKKGEYTKDLAAKGGKNIIHHIASNKHLSKYTAQFEVIANKYGLELNGAWNKVDISDVDHYSKHPAQYHEFVLNGMKAADLEAAGNPTKFLKLFDKYVKQPLLQNPNILNKTGW